MKEFDSSNMDATVWAKEFMNHYMDHKYEPKDWIDYDIMLSWFANAIMAGYDEAKRRYEK